jgi:hypothetical protein
VGEGAGHRGGSAGDVEALEDVLIPLPERFDNPHTVKLGAEHGRSNLNEAFVIMVDQDRMTAPVNVLAHEPGHSLYWLTGSVNGGSSRQKYP